MAHAPNSTVINALSRSQQPKGSLRFIICGSIGSGKRTLTGRLPYPSKILFDGQLAMLDAGAKKKEMLGARHPDSALLAEGWSADHEQIDTACRLFSADVAVILIDASQGILSQSRQHSHLISQLGIRKVILAINKMDLMDYSEKVFQRIVDDYRGFARQIGLEHITAIPLSALYGDNVFRFC